MTAVHFHTTIECRDMKASPENLKYSRTLEDEPPPPPPSQTVSHTRAAQGPSCSCNLKVPDVALDASPFSFVFLLCLQMPPLQKGQCMALELISSEFLLGNLASNLSLSLSFLRTAGLSCVSLPDLSPSGQCDSMHGIEWSDYKVHMWSGSNLFIRPYVQIFFLRLWTVFYLRVILILWDSHNTELLLKVLVPAPVYFPGHTACQE